MQSSVQVCGDGSGNDDGDIISNSSSDPSVNHFWQKMLSAILITLPVLGLSALGTSNFNQVTDQLVYMKFGGELGNRSEQNATCTGSLNKSGEDHAQASASEFRLYSRMGRCAAAFVFLPVWGAHTDRFGRHTAVIVGAVSALMYSIPLLLVALVDAIPLWILILGDTLHGVFGNSGHLQLLACASFTADIFPEGQRILMMICLDTIFFLANTAGSVGGGYWIQASGFIPVVICMVAFNVCVLLYGILFFPKLVKHHKYRRAATDQVRPPPSALQYFTKTYKTFTKQRRGYGRAFLILTVTVVMAHKFSTCGIFSIFNIYVLGTPLCWDAVLLGIYNGVQCAGFAVFPVIMGLVFRKTSNKNTAWLVLVAVLSDTCKSISFGFASRTPMVFVAAILGSLSVLITPGARTIIADIVHIDEQGAAIAGYTVATLLADFLSNPLFNAVFVVTLSTFNRCVFFVAAGFDVISLLFLGVYGGIKLRDKRIVYQALQNPDVR